MKQTVLLQIQKLQDEAFDQKNHVAEERLSVLYNTLKGGGVQITGTQKDEIAATLKSIAERLKVAELLSNEEKFDK